MISVSIKQPQSLLKCKPWHTSHSFLRFMDAFTVMAGPYYGIYSVYGQSHHRLSNMKKQAWFALPATFNILAGEMRGGRILVFHSRIHIHFYGVVIYINVCHKRIHSCSKGMQISEVLRLDCPPPSGQVWDYRLFALQNSLSRR